MQRCLSVAGAMLALAVATPSAADPWKDESGHGRGGYGYEYKDGNCKYEYKAGPDGIKEERKCHSAPWVLPPMIILGKDTAATLPEPPPGPIYGEVYRDERGRYCREYQTTGTVGGKVEPLYGTACLQPDGSWQLAE